MDANCKPYTSALPLATALELERQERERAQRGIAHLPGTAVWAKTVSGQWIPCEVISYGDGEYLLFSPEHGYAISRGRREVKRTR